MRELFKLLIHFIVTLIKLSKPGGVKALVSENQALKLQLIVMNRGNKRSPKLTTRDRFLFGFLTLFIGENRLNKIAVIIKPATILGFHRALVKHVVILRVSFLSQGVDGSAQANRRFSKRSITFMKELYGLIYSSYTLANISLLIGLAFSWCLP